MVVGPVIDGFPRVFRQHSHEIHRGQARFLRRVLDKRSLIEAGRALRQPVLPDLCRRGDQPQKHLAVSRFSKPLHIVQILLHLKPVRFVHLGDKGIAAEVDAVEFPLAQQLLTPGLQARPVVPQRELVGKIVLHPRGKAAVFQGFPGKVRELGQRPVFRFGACPVRQRNVPHQQSCQKQAEDPRGQPSLVRHAVSSLLGQNKESESEIQKRVVAAVYQVGRADHQTRRHQQRPQQVSRPLRQPVPALLGQTSGANR